MLHHRRPPAWAVLATIGTALLGVGVGMDVVAEDAPPMVGLAGQGDSDLIGRIVTFQDAMFEAEQPTEVSYNNSGSAQGRKNLLAGKADFIVSGAPFTSGELAGRPAGAGAIIDVPVSIVALAVVMTTPPQVGWQTYQAPTDPSCGTEDEIPELCVGKEGSFDGPFRVPADNLSALIVGLATSAENNLNAWANPEWAAALGTSDMRIQFERLRAHTWINRSEPASQTSALLTYVGSMSPDVWSARLEQDDWPDWKVGGERTSPNTKPTKQTTDQVANFIGFSTLDPLTQSGWGTGVWTGNAGAIPVTYLEDLREDFPAAGLRLMEIQNRHGDWVTPTQATIEAALAADPEGMAVGATSDVAGAYPLVYLNHLYTVAGTLSPDEANSLAAFVRYLVTDGQDELVASGTAALPAAQQAEALAAADEIVVANCTEAGYEVTTSGPSAFEPSTPKVQALTSMKHCTLKPAPTTTTSTTTTIAPTTTVVEATTSTTTPATTTTTTTTLVESAAPVTSTPSSTPSYAPTYTPTYTPTATAPATLPANEETDSTVTSEETTTTLVEETTVPPETTAPVAEATGGGGTRPRGVALRSLPMVLPDDGSADYKKLGTLLLGAALFLLGRRIVLARRFVPS